MRHCCCILYKRPICPCSVLPYLHTQTYYRYCSTPKSTLAGLQDGDNDDDFNLDADANMSELRDVLRSFQVRTGEITAANEL